MVSSSSSSSFWLQGHFSMSYPTSLRWPRWMTALFLITHRQSLIMLRPQPPSPHTPTHTPSPRPLTPAGSPQQWPKQPSVAAVGVAAVHLSSNSGNNSSNTCSSLSNHSTKCNNSSNRSSSSGSIRSQDSSDSPRTCSATSWQLAPPLLPLRRPRWRRTAEAEVPLGGEARRPPWTAAGGSSLRMEQRGGWRQYQGATCRRHRRPTCRKLAALAAVAETMLATTTTRCCWAAASTCRSSWRSRCSS